FLMKDSDSRGLDGAARDRAYAAHKAADCTIFDRCGARYLVVESDPGMMGGFGSHECTAPSAAGEDEIAVCRACGYAANVELARSVPAPPPPATEARVEVATPNAKTIAEVSALLGLGPRRTVKSLLYFAAKAGPVLALVRGDHTLHERKLARLLGEEVRPAHADEVRSALGAGLGSIGPVGVTVPAVADA